jgi:hypothetical protein
MIRLLFGLMVLISFGALAGDPKVLLVGEFNPSSKAERISVGKGLLARVEMIRAHLPAQQEREIDWVNTELAVFFKLDAKAMAKKTATLFGGREYAHMEFGKQLNALTNLLSKIVNDPMPLKGEMRLWATTSLAFGQQTSAVDKYVSTLIKAGRLPKDIQKTADLVAPAFTLGDAFRQYSVGIQAKIVIPYLADEIVR